MPNLERANEFNVALSRFFSTLATVKRAVPASVAATGPAPEMVSCGEDDVSARVVIVIVFATGPMRILETAPGFCRPLSRDFPVRAQAAPQSPDKTGTGTSARNGLLQ
jgi:hypothetical protein